LEEWEPLRDEAFYTKQYQEEQLDNELSDIYNRRSFRLWVFKKEDSSRSIGTVGFSNIVWGAFQSCHLGYKLDKDEINKGS